MQSLSATQKSTILLQLDAGHSICLIASNTGVGIATISRLCSKECANLQKSAGGHPSKLSPSIFNMLSILSPLEKLRMLFK